VNILFKVTHITKMLLRLLFTKQFSANIKNTLTANSKQVFSHVLQNYCGLR